MKRLAGLVVVLTALPACKTVAPSQRGTLQSPVMQTSEDPLEQAIEAHVNETRESALGGTDVGGPSCGCN